MANPNNCRHQNIHWNDLFKKPKQNKAYCIDCNADRGKMVAVSIQRWYCKKVEEWLKDNGLTEKYFFEGKEQHFTHDFIRFLQKNNSEHLWKDLKWGKIDENFEGIGEGVGGQIVFWEAADGIEYLCEEFKKEKQQENPNDNNDQQIQKKNKIKRLKRIIKRLENKTNRTAEEEAELASKQQELANLESEQNNNTNNNPWLQPTLIIGSVVIVIGLVIYLTTSKKKERS